MGRWPTSLVSDGDLHGRSQLLFVCQSSCINLFRVWLYIFLLPKNTPTQPPSIFFRRANFEVKLRESFFCTKNLTLMRVQIPNFLHYGAKFTAALCCKNFFLSIWFNIIIYWDEDWCSKTYFFCKFLNFSRKLMCFHYGWFLWTSSDQFCHF